MNNIYFQHLNIGIDWILKDKDFINNLSLTVANKPAAHWKLEIKELTKEFLDWLDNYNLSVKYAEIFYCAAKSDIFLHSDEINTIDCCKLNWVYDQGDTWMRWAKLKEGRKIIKQNNTIGGTYYTAAKDDYDYVEKTNIKRPTLINAYHLHDVINPTDHSRWCVSIVPKYKNVPESRLTMQEAAEILQPYFSS